MEAHTAAHNTPHKYPTFVETDNKLNGHNAVAKDAFKYLWALSP